MSDNLFAYTLALTANIIFAFSVQIFTHYSRKISAIWMNFVKAFIAMILFLGAIVIMGWNFSFSNEVLLLLFVSGILGLGIGDLALLTALRDLGPGRAMVIVAFHPVIMGIFSYLRYGKGLSSYKILAIFFMILCIFVFSLESMKKVGNWGVKGIALVLSAIILDVIGVLMIKEAELLSKINPFEASFYRCLGVVVFFLIWNQFKPFNIIEGIKKQSKKSTLIILAGAFLGTFLALAIIFKAYTTVNDNLATISSINISCSLFAALFECIHEKKKPGRYLIISFLLMICGVSIFLFVE